MKKILIIELMALLALAGTGVAQGSNPLRITCPLNRTNWICGGSFAFLNYPLPTTTGSCPTNATVTCSPPPTATFILGSTTVSCRATNACRESAVCSFTVTVAHDTTPPALPCPGRITVAHCSPCAVTPCATNTSLPIRPASIGNGLFYSSAFALDQTFVPFGQQMAENIEDGYHAVSVNAYQPVGASGDESVKFSSSWVRDDDSAFFDGLGVTRNGSAESLQMVEQAQQSLRPISLSGYKTSANESRFAVAYLRDDANYPWRLIVDRDFDQYQAQFEALAALGFRPICVSGYSSHGENPRYSGIFVQDGLAAPNWVTAHRIAEADYQAWYDQYANQNFSPISVSAYTIGNETFFTSVMVRVPDSGLFVAGHGMTKDELLAANDTWTNPANQYHTTLRPVSVAAYRSFYNGGAERYTAVWRGSAPRVFTRTGVAPPSLGALDQAMENFMRSNDVNAATLCVARNGGIVLHRGYTWAPGEFKLTRPCSRFRMASASKAVTATAVMKLLEGNPMVGLKGGGAAALTLDSRVFQLVGLPDLPAAYGRDAQGITIRHLLQHRAGWGYDFEPLYNDVQVAAALFKNLPVTRQDMIDYMMTPSAWPVPGESSSVGFPGEDPPGSESRYSNFGFSLLAKLIEVVSQQSYETYVRNNVLLPIGANRTRLGFTGRLLAWTGPDEVTYTAGNSYHQGDTDHRRWYVSDLHYDPLNIRNPTTLSVVFPQELGAWHPTTAYGRYNIHTIDAAGGWVATSDDMVRLLQSFDSFDPDQPNAGTPLLDWDSVWEMWSNPNNIFNFPQIGDKYVLGWQQTTRMTSAGKVIVHSHGGNVDGALSSIVRRSDGISFAAMFSREAGGGAYTALNDAIETITTWPVCSDSAIVTYPTPVATDNADTNVSVVCLPPSGSSFPLGSTPVICTATDDCTNRNTCTFLITVHADTIRPVINCPKDQTAWTCFSEAVVTYPAPEAFDNLDPHPSIGCVPPSGSHFAVGTTTVNCTATDQCDNRSECRFSVTVNYGLPILSEVEPNDALAGAHDLGLASFVSVVGRISPAGDLDYYRFSAVPNSRVWITVDTGGRKWAGANSRDSVLALLDAGGDLIETDDNDGSGNGANSMLESGDASAIAGATLAGGTYYVSVSSVHGGIIAPYRLYLTVTTNNAATESEPNNSFEQPNTIVTPAGPIGVRVASLALNDEDWYAIGLAEPSLLHLSVDGDPERDGTGTNTRLDLFRRDGASLLFTADSSGASDAVAEGFVYRLSLPGTYYLRVRSASLPPTTGTYRVMVAHCPLPAPPTPGIVHRDGLLTLSWPVALEPCVLRSSRDLRTWSFRNLTPLMEGNQLRIELPSASTHDFFQLIPAGGFNNAVTACCDANGCRLPRSSGEECIGQIYWCYETENSSVCEPLGPPHPDAED